MDNNVDRCFVFGEAAKSTCAHVDRYARAVKMSQRATDVGVGLLVQAPAIWIIRWIRATLLVPAETLSARHGALALDSCRPQGCEARHSLGYLNIGTT